jgi:hypothetical protein
MFDDKPYIRVRLANHLHKVALGQIKDSTYTRLDIESIRDAERTMNGRAFEDWCVRFYDQTLDRNAHSHHRPYN